MSALIVSQKRVAATVSSVTGRLLGTALGIVVALLVHWGGAAVHMSVIAQIAAAVAVCAVWTDDHPVVRVALWTCPLVLVATGPEDRVEMTALFRGTEIMIGAAIGGLVHLCDEMAFALLMRGHLAVLQRRSGRMSGEGGRSASETVVR